MMSAIKGVSGIGLMACIDINAGVGGTDTYIFFCMLSHGFLRLRIMRIMRIRMVHVMARITVRLNCVNRVACISCVVDPGDT